jgi:hypothetical protein
MTEARNDIFKEGDFISDFRAKGLKISKALISFDKLMPQLTIEEIERVRRELAILMLTRDDDLDPELRRELLSEFDTCPCCQTWLGHNRPPADDDDAPRRQTSFDFER